MDTFASPTITSNPFTIHDHIACSVGPVAMAQGESNHTRPNSLNHS